MNNSIDNHIPIREVTIPVKRLICEPWLTKGLIKCGKKQLKLYKRSIKSGNKDDIDKYKKYRSNLQKKSSTIVSDNSPQTSTQNSKMTQSSYGEP